MAVPQHAKSKRDTHVPTVPEREGPVPQFAEILSFWEAKSVTTETQRQTMAVRQVVRSKRGTAAVGLPPSVLRFAGIWLSIRPKPVTTETQWVATAVPQHAKLRRDMSVPRRPTRGETAQQFAETHKF